MTARIVIQISFLTIFFSCVNRGKPDSNVLINETASDSLKQTSKLDTVTSAQTPDYLMIAKQFAENYSPDSIGAGQLKNIPDSVATAFKKLGQIDRKEQEKYLTLVFLKLYRGHLQCCHQSYETRSNHRSASIDSITDPLLFEYNQLTNQYNTKKPIEFIASNIGFDWTEKHKTLLRFDKIKREYKTILKIHKSIENHEFWK